MSTTHWKPLILTSMTTTASARTTSSSTIATVTTRSYYSDFHYSVATAKGGSDLSLKVSCQFLVVAVYCMFDSHHGDCIEKVVVIGTIDAMMFACNILVLSISQHVGWWCILAIHVINHINVLVLLNWHNANRQEQHEYRNDKINYWKENKSWTNTTTYKFVAGGMIYPKIYVWNKKNAENYYLSIIHLSSQEKHTCAPVGACMQRVRDLSCGYRQLKHTGKSYYITHVHQIDDELDYGVIFSLAALLKNTSEISSTCKLRCQFFVSLCSTMSKPCFIHNYGYYFICWQDSYNKKPQQQQHPMTMETTWNDLFSLVEKQQK